MTETPTIAPYNGADSLPPAHGRTTRVSPLRVLVLLLVTVGMVAGAVWVIKPTVLPPPPPGPMTFAGYVDLTAVPSYSFETPVDPALQDVILGFVVASPGDPCTPSWGGYYNLDQASNELEVERRISQLRLTGGQARVSFGGQANTDLASACADVAALTTAYQQVVDRYELTSIDLDIEGAALDDAAGMTRRATAIKAMQDKAAAADAPLTVWLTLPVGATGLTDQGLKAVQVMLAAGVEVAGVNGMTMDYNDPAAVSGGMAAAVENSATALRDQVVTLFGEAGTDLSGPDAWGHVGITPMIGQTDVAGEVFSIEDAQAVNAFAQQSGLGLVSMWSLNRDSTCSYPLPAVMTIVQGNCSGVDQNGFSYATILGTDAASGSFADPTASAVAATPEPSPLATSPVIVDDPSTSPFPIWDPLGTYPAGTKVVWKRTVYEARFWTSGFAPDSRVETASDTPWTVLGPVLPGDTPAPLPTMAAGTYSQWSADRSYVAGARVQLGLVPYQAKWWTQGQQPGTSVSGGSPWTLVYPTETG